MSKPFQVGVTGSIGSGKSLICKIFMALGVPVYDADSHAKKLMTTDGILVSAIKKEFGDLAYHGDGSLNRNYLAEHVFHDEEKLQRLNQLVHPRVAVDYSNWVEKHQRFHYVLKEAALLFESGSYQSLDRIIVVHAPVEMRIQRVQKRDARTVEQIKAIVEKQMPDDEKLNRADDIIVNDESVLLIPQVLKLHNEFMGHRK